MKTSQVAEALGLYRYCIKSVPKGLLVKQAFLSFFSLSFWGHCLTFCQTCSSLKLFPVSPLWNIYIRVSSENCLCRTTEL